MKHLFAGCQLIRGHELAERCVDRQSGFCARADHFRGHADLSVCVGNPLDLMAAWSTLKTFIHMLHLSA